MATKSSAKKTTAKKSTSSSSSSIRKMKHDKWALAIIAGILLIFLLAFLFKGLFVVATVNGEPITRMEVIRALEKQGGQQVLDSMVTRRLIEQEANDKKVVVVQAEIDTEIGKIEDSLKEQETTLDEALALQGLSRAELIEDIKLQLLIQKLVEERTEVGEDELKIYLEENAEFFAEDVTDEQKMEQGREQLLQQKIQLETQNLITDLQGNSKTIILFQY